MVFIKASKDEIDKLTKRDFSGDLIYDEDSEVLSLFAAVDIGTTTVAVELYAGSNYKGNENFVPGKFVTGRTEKNIQTIMGADVMMRLMHCIEGRQERLHAMIVKQIGNLINDSIQDAIDEFGEFEYKLKKINVVGNSAMCHIFLNEETEGLAHAPFKTSYEGYVKKTANELGFEGFDDAIVTVLPGIGSHVGSDALSALCEVRLFDSEDVSILVDIGTNAEIMLKKGARIFATSVAAGPAFEGVGTAMGMRAQPGACNMVRIAPDSETILIDMIDGDNLRGICAAGYIDVISQLVRYGAITTDGYMYSHDEAYDNNPYLFMADRIYDYHGKPAFLLCGQNNKNDQCIKNGKVYDGKSNHGRNIYVTQDDVRQFQMAKAAIYAGISRLLDLADAKYEDISTVFVAGMLGNSISIAECINIGLFPNIDAKKFKLIGNAALEGAARSLFDEEFEEFMEIVLKQIVRIELADDDEFDKEYINAFELVKG